MSQIRMNYVCICKFFSWNNKKLFALNTFSHKCKRCCIMRCVKHDDDTILYASILKINNLLVCSSMNIFANFKIYSNILKPRVASLMAIRSCNTLLQYALSILFYNTLIQYSHTILSYIHKSYYWRIIIMRKVLFP